MTELTDEAVKSLAHKYRFAKDDNERTIAKTAEALLDARAESARLRADAQAANGVWQANLRLQGELAAAQQREAKLREAGARLLGHATQDMSEQMDAWDAFEAALSNNGRGE